MVEEMDMKFEELKAILFSEILSDNRRKEMLIEAYIHSPQYVRKMAAEGKIASEAIEFLENNIQKLVDIPAHISIQFFRNVKYEELIKEYCDRKVNEMNEKKPVDNPVAKKIIEPQPEEKVEETNHKKHHEFVEAYTKEWLIKNWDTKPKSFMKTLIEQTKKGNIVWEESELDYSFYIDLDDDRRIIVKKNGKKGKVSYSITRTWQEQISKQNYNELCKAIKDESCDIKDNKKDKPGKTEVIYLSDAEMSRSFGLYRDLVPLHLPGKKSKQLKAIEVHKSTVKRIKETDKEYGYLIRRTDEGELVWNRVNNSGLKDNVYIALDNGNKLLLHCYSTENAFLYRFYVNGKQTSIGGIQQYLEKIILKKRTEVVDNINLSGYYPVGKEKGMMKKDPPVANKSIIGDKAQRKRTVNVGFKDFVIRRNVFKCMHNNHSLEDIDAVVKIMNKNAEIEEITVAAGYCRKCNMFFMMESTYQHLRRKGVVVFRAVDEKNYLSQNYLNGKLLAQESILMQFGYSVSQTEGLSEERRHKILSVLVDNHIMTKSEIISYLDFFINQRKSDKFAMAVAKWTIDRNYIRNYKVGEYSKIGVVYRND